VRGEGPSRGVFRELSVLWGVGRKNGGAGRNLIYLTIPQVFIIYV